MAERLVISSWVTLVIFITTAESCPLDFFRFTMASKNMADANNKSICVPCTVCDPGHGVQADCLEKSNTVCRKCTTDEYSEREWDKRVCVKCKSCAAFSRETLKACTSLNDTVCGDCLPGFAPSDNDECISPLEDENGDSEFKALADQAKQSETEENLRLKRSFITRVEFAKIELMASISMALFAAMALSITVVAVKKHTQKHRNKCLCVIRKAQQDTEVLIQQDTILSQVKLDQEFI